MLMSNFMGPFDFLKFNYKFAILEENKAGSQGLFSWGSFKAKPNANGTHNLALYEEPEVDGEGNFISSYIKGYTTPGPKEREESKKAKVSKK